MSIFRKITIVYGFENHDDVSDIEEAISKAAKRFDAEPQKSSMYEFRTQDIPGLRTYAEGL